MKTCKLLVAAAGATVLLGVLVSSASARNFSVSNQNLSVMWRSLEFALPGATTRCAVTLEGSLHTRTLPKVAGSLIGYVTKAILGPCSFGTATLLSGNAALARQVLRLCWYPTRNNLNYNPSRQRRL